MELANKPIPLSRLTWRRLSPLAAALLASAVVACQQPIVPPSALQNADRASVSLGAPNGASISVVFRLARALTTLAVGKTSADVNHYRVSLFRQAGGSQNLASDTEVAALTVTPVNIGNPQSFTSVPAGTYYVAANAFSSADDSVSVAQGGVPATSASQAVVGSNAYNLVAALTLASGTGGGTTITVTVPAGLPGAKTYGFAVVDQATHKVVSTNQTTSTTVNLANLKNGSYDLWSYVIYGANQITPARIIGSVTVAGDVTTVGGALGATYDGTLTQVPGLVSTRIRGMTTAASGDVYVANAGGNCVQRINAGTLGVTTVVGNGAAGDGVDGDDPLGAVVNAPESVAVDGNGNLFIEDLASGRLRAVPASGMTRYGKVMLAGKLYNLVSNTVDHALAIDPAANLFYNLLILPATREIHQLTPAGADSLFTATPGRADGMATDALGNVYYTFGTTVHMQVVQPGKYFGADRLAGDVTLNLPGGCIAIGVAVDPAGDLYCADQTNNKVYMIPSSGTTVYTLAGGGGGAIADGSLATAVGLTSPRGVAVASDGKLYFTTFDGNAGGHVVERVR